MRKQLLSIVAAAGIAATSLTAFSAQPAEAAIFNPNCTVGSLRAHLASAALLGGPHIVVLPAGCVYSFANTSLTNPDSALPAITKNVVILGNGATFERAAGAPAMRFLEVRGGVSLAVSNLTMTGGLNPPADAQVLGAAYAGQSNGGAIRCTEGSLILEGVTLNANEAGNGGAIFTEDCDVTIANSTVIANSASAGDGGAVAITIYDDPDVVLTVNGSSINDNFATENGGAILASIHHINIEYSDLKRNSALGDGGGIHLTTHDVQAGAIRFSTLHGNDADGDGGALFMAEPTNGAIGIEFSTISNNTAANGGGLVMAYGGIHRSTVSGNLATTGVGGGLFLNWATVTLHRATIANNSATGGIGNAIAGDGAINPINSLVAYSTAIPAGTLCDVTGGLLLYPGAPGSLSEGTCLGFTTMVGGSAALDPLANNGGPTRTHALGIASLAIDAGDQASCDSALWMGAHDQRGLPFVETFGAACDVGSFEVQ